MTKQSKRQNKVLVLLDMHAILHRAYHALADFKSNVGEPTGALYCLVIMLLSFVEQFNPDYISGFYELPKPTFKKEMYADYKAGRAKTDDELKAQMQRSRDVLTAFGIPYYELEGFEADDLLGTISEKLK